MDKNGDRYLLKLIFTTNNNVLDAIILGDIGWRSENLPDFKKKLYSKDSSAGIYLVTFLVDGRHMGLTRTGWSKVADTARL